MKALVYFAMLEGLKAYQGDIPVTENPYEYMTVEYIAWRQAWFEEQSISISVAKNSS